jgi:hypothetical protein
MRAATRARLLLQRDLGRKTLLEKLRRKTMRFCHDELTLDELLADPVIGAVMHADGVDPDELGAELARFAEEQDALAA